MQEGSDCPLLGSREWRLLLDLQTPGREVILGRRTRQTGGGCLLFGVDPARSRVGRELVGGGFVVLDGGKALRIGARSVRLVGGALAFGGLR